MVKKFNTVAPSVDLSSSSDGLSSKGSGNMLKTVLIIGAVAAIAYFGYRYYIRKKQETVVYIDESEDY